VHEQRFAKKAIALKYKLEHIMQKDNKLSTLITFEPIKISRN
jgi:hypothetical protein